ncbi:MAG: methyltransferase domain-containing protein [Bacteroidales bacterium]
MYRKKHYDATYLEVLSEIYKDVKDYTTEWIMNEGPESLLDLGCGKGIDTFRLANFVSEVVGIDHDPRMLEVAKEHLFLYDNVNLHRREAEDTGYEDEYFDCILADRIILHLFNPEKVLREMMRVLKKDGSCIIVETDWCSMNFFSPYIMQEFEIIQTKVNEVLHNGLSCRIVSHQFQEMGMELEDFKIFPLITNRYEIADYILRLEVVYKTLQEKGVNIDKLRKYMAEKEEKGQFMASWDVFVYHFRK